MTNPAGDVIIPDRSSAQLVIRQMSSGGATGSPEMVLDIQSITIEGRRYLVSTADLTLESDTGIGKNKRTAKAIGRVRRSARSSARSRVAARARRWAPGGAAGGAGAQVLTRGRDVRVAAETVLTFRLDRPVTLRPEW